MDAENSWFRMASYWDELETCRRVWVWFWGEADRLEPVGIYNKLKRPILGKEETNKKVWELKKRKQVI